MPIIGFNFEKFLVERTAPLEKGIKVTNSMQITDVNEETIEIAYKKQDTLKVNFEFSLIYAPKIGKITINGFLRYTDDLKVMKDVLKIWKKEKRFPPEITAKLLNTAILKSNIRALTLAEEVGLPPHLPIIPTIRPRPKTPESEYIG